MGVMSAVGTALLDYVYTQLGSTTNSFPCVKKLAVCEPHDECCDYLAVFVDSFGDPVTVDSCPEFRTTIQYTLKLMRPCNTQTACNPSQEDHTAVVAMLDDAEALRTAVMRFTQLDTTGEYTFDVGPLIPICGQAEQCSGWAMQVAVRVNSCFTEFTGPIILPTRCADCVQLPVMLQPEIVQILEEYA